MEEVTARDAALDFASSRRNVLTRGIDVNSLVGREFTVDGARCCGLRLASRAPTWNDWPALGLLRPLIHRGGLRADILTNGVTGVGSTISS